VEEVGQGVELVKSAGDVLGRIVDASQRVTSTVSEISTAADEQANGIDEMSQAVAHMDEMTQQNAALAEESAASASSLTEQIQRLNEVVAQFKVRNQAYASPSVPHRLRQEAAAAFASQKAASGRPQIARKSEAYPKKVASGGARAARWDEF
jgi:methyl-accepting chemotaxis protein